MDETKLIECECGQILEKGWICNTCRINCPKCNRALSAAINEYCTRCCTRCELHGVVKLSDQGVCLICDS